MFIGRKHHQLEWNSSHPRELVTHHLCPSGLEIPRGQRFGAEA